jgi:hypothetical protein
LDCEDGVFLCALTGSVADCGTKREGVIFASADLAGHHRLTDAGDNA